MSKTQPPEEPVKPENPKPKEATKVKYQPADSDFHFDGTVESVNPDGTANILVATKQANPCPQAGFRILNVRKSDKPKADFYWEA